MQEDENKKKKKDQASAAMNKHKKQDYHRQIAVVSATDDETSVEGSNAIERAETGAEFKKDATVCKNCRMTDAHYTKNCQNPPYCSLCKNEGHTDEQHGNEQQTMQQSMQARGGGQGEGVRGGGAGGGTECVRTMEEIME